MRPLRYVICAMVLILASVACNLGAIPPSPTPRPTIIPTVIITVSPPPTASPTATTDSGGTVLQPDCTPRSDWPVYRVQSGDTLSSIAQRAGTDSTTLQNANCLANQDRIFAGDQIRVPKQPVPPTPNTASTAMAGCTNAWFFRFSGSAVEQNTCPGPVYASPAAGQDFEGGRAYYYAAINGVIGPSVYVMYNDATWERYDDTFNGNLEPASDPSIVPPSGRYQPVRAIGKVWRNNPTVRSKLGWAFAPESDFAGRRQLAMNSSVWYIDHGVHNIVLRMDNGRWTVEGVY